MLKKRLQADYITAMKSKHIIWVRIIRGLIAELKNEEIKLGKECDEPTEMTVLTREVGKYQEALDFAFQSTRPNRLESISTCGFELETVKHYLPQQLSEGEVKEMIQSSLASLPSPSLGLVMKELTPKLKGKFDMKKVTELVKAAINCRKNV